MADLSAANDADWSLDKGLLQFQNRIYVPNEYDTEKVILQLYHNLFLAGHGGKAKTMEFV